MTARRGVLAALALALLLAAGGRPAAANGLFGSLEFSSPNLAAIPQWTAVMQRIRAERPSISACDGDPGACATSRVRDWRGRVASLHGQGRAAQVDAVNRYVNGVVPYITDYENYGISDYWASPLEFLRRSGDCEDYAIAKFISLLDLGHANETMRIVVVNDIVRNIAHAVLAVELDGRMLILDSLLGEVNDHMRLSQYVPQYSVNLDTRWAHIMR